MKIKTLLSVLSIGFILSAFSQKPTIELTFTAENNGQYVPMDSILIENLTQGGDTTLYAPDTILSFEYSLGVNEIDLSKNSFSISQNYPNPFEGKTIFNLYLLEMEHIFINIRDIVGRELAEYEYILTQGNHTFSFYSGKEKYYLLTVTGKQKSQTIKMLNSAIYTTNDNKYQIVYIRNNVKVSDFKFQKSINNFIFSLGDELKYNAFTALGDQTIIDTPDGNQTYTFQYSSGSIPCPGIPTVTDIDGNEYNTVLIGDQCWMKEDLKTTTYRNGTPIPNITDPDEWEDLISDAYVWYDNNEIAWKDKYGALYNWYATVDPNGLCPSGWHVLTNDEWTALTDFIGGTVSPHGNELKSCRQVNSPLGGGCNTSDQPRWHPDVNSWGTDDYGFSGVPGGSRDVYGTFLNVGKKGNWWSSTESSSYYAWGFYLSYDYGFVYVFENTYKQHGFSVRCLKD